MNLDLIKNNTKWEDAANSINSNFNKTNLEVTKIAASSVKHKGYFTTEAALLAAQPSPKVGDNAYVGATYPGVVYICNTAGMWTATTTVPSPPAVTLSEYYKKTETDAIVDAVESNITSLETDLSYLNGISLPVNLSSATLTASGWWANDYPYIGLIKGIEINCSAGSITVAKISKENFKFTNIGTYTVVDGINNIIFSSEIKLDSSDKIFVYGAKYLSSISNKVGALNYDGVTIISNNDIYIGYNLIPSNTTFKGLINYIDSSDKSNIDLINELKNKTIIDSSMLFTDWSNSGFTLVENYYMTGNAGALIVSPRLIGINNITLRAIIATESVTKFTIGYKPSEGNMRGTAVTFDMQANTATLSKYNGSSLSSLKTWNNAIITGANKFIVEIEQNPYKTIIRFGKYDDYINAELPEIGVYDIPTANYSSYPTVNFAEGICQGTPFVLIDTAHLNVYSLSILSNSNPNPYLYIAGDSTSEGFGVDNNLTYPSLLKSILGKKNVVCSGVGGATTYSAKNRIINEVRKLRPNNVLIFLGTNIDNGDTSSSASYFEANMREIISAISAYTNRIMLATVYNRSGATGVINTLHSEGLCDVVNFAGSMQNSFYDNIDKSSASYNDGMHPNALGHSVLASLVMQTI